MDSTIICGHNVMFPFKPYPLQKAYMSQVIQCLKDKKNGLLESPTGTGKTLSLLCSSLAWLEKKNLVPVLDIFDENGKKEEEPDTKNGSKDGKNDAKKGSLWGSDTTKILYSSRTHAQLSQACKEMKRTYYRNMKAVVIGGRDNLCINDEVQALESNAAKTHACRAKVQAKQCVYYNNYEKKVFTTADFVDTPILDIEDLNRLGKKHKVCPYYASRLVKQRSDVVFTPYNYLLDPSARKALGIEIMNNVIIFDEGHNIERVCEDSVSCELKSATLEFILNELKTLLHQMRNSSTLADTLGPEAFEAMQNISLDNVKYLRDTVLSIQEEIEEAIQGTEDKKILPQQWIFDVLNKNGLTFGNYKKVKEAIDELLSFVFATALIPGQGSMPFSSHLQKLNDFFAILFPEGYNDEEAWEGFKKEFIKKYRVFTEKECEEEKLTTNAQKRQKFHGWLHAKKKAALDQKQPWSLYLWCLSASIGLGHLQKQGVHSMIITSGTLAPLNSFQVELELPFPVTLQNAHVIDSSQIGIYIIRSAFNGITFNSSYENRGNMEHSRAIGQSIVHYCRTIPNGILLFFSSYAVMNNMLNLWKEKDKEWKVYSSICAEKQIFLEPQNKNAFADCIEKFKERVDAPRSKGAIFMGVCRGKLSEGLDMADHYCRGVIMIGLPFPAVADPRVVLKKQYLQEMNNKALTPNDWYTLQMKRALNQAIGRIVRNKDDYGVVLLLDTRFEKHVSGLSRWMQKFVQIKSFADASSAIEAFFQRNEARAKTILVERSQSKSNIEVIEPNQSKPILKISPQDEPRAPSGLYKRKEPETNGHDLTRHESQGKFKEEIKY